MRVRTEHGFSLVEALVAIALLTVGVGGLAQLSIVATHAGQRARVVSTVSMLAVDKMDQLRALVWRFDEAGVALSDDSSDTTVAPPTSAGGTGLSPSPAGTLAQNLDGYCDFLDDGGRLLSGGADGTAPPGTTYVRRWAIDLLPADPDTLVVQVLVTTAALSFGESAHLVSLRTRRGPD